MATWGIKVTDELKEKLDRVKKESGLEGEQFAAQLVTLFLTEELKAQKPHLSGELEELQGLTQRIYGIYMHSAERTENLLQSKEENYAAAIARNNTKIKELEIAFLEEEQKYTTIVEAYNNVSEDKKKSDEEIKQFVDSLKTKQELIEEYRSKNDTLSGIVNEYKAYKETNLELSNLLQDKENILGQANLSLKDKEGEIKRLNNIVSTLQKDHADKLTDIKENNKAELDRIKQQHLEGVETVKEKAEIIKDKALVEADKKHQLELKTLTEGFNSKISTLQDKVSVDNEKYKALLEELEK